MANPIYKWTLAANGGQETQAYPVYKDDLAKEYELQSNQEFYRAKLSGKLRFGGEDYTFISSQSFDTRFVLRTYISYDAGQTWTEYWVGNFWKTDCEINEDDKNITVTPTVSDQYDAVLAGMEKEYNLIDLSPAIEQISIDKRPMVQVYVPGQTVIGCFLSGMWWEQECESVLESDTVEISGHNYPALIYKYHFFLNRVLTIADISGTTSPQLPEFFLKTTDGLDRFDLATMGTQDFPGTDYTFRYYFYVGGGGATQKWAILRNSDSAVLWLKELTGAMPIDTTIPQTVVLPPVPGSGATGDVTLYIHDMPVYARNINDLDTAYPLPEDDLVENNRNYKGVLGYYSPQTITFFSLLTGIPTKWGLYQPGEYYVSPADISTTGIGEAYPIARNTWGRISVWFVASLFEWPNEKVMRKEFTLRDAYPIWSVISVLLGQIAPGISHDGTTEYSEFLYGTNPISEIYQKLFITPKSNVITSGYDQPAQKAPITLKRILDMLRDCFRCYWFIDDQDRFRIEHISWFMNGGAYPGTPDYPVVSMDLTVLRVSRNGKPWSFASNKYQFDKPEMASRYQFGWMDDVTELFNGYPIDILSNYVSPDNIERIDLSQFTSDIDYILLNPGEISKDGFVLLATDSDNKLPYVNFLINQTDHYLQNAWVSFTFLQRYYAYDMPARRYRINGVDRYALGIKKLKTQSIKFPVSQDLDVNNLIKTSLGSGKIKKMSINLSSRNATTTLKYDTE